MCLSGVHPHVCGPVRKSADSHFWHLNELFSTGFASTPKTFLTFWTNVTIKTKKKFIEYWWLCMQKKKASQTRVIMSKHKRIVQVIGCIELMYLFQDVYLCGCMQVYILQQKGTQVSHIFSHTDIHKQSKFEKRAQCHAFHWAWRSSPPVLFYKTSCITVVEVIGDWVSLCVKKRCRCMQEMVRLLIEGWQYKL